jgi:hypothetical protein
MIISNYIPNYPKIQYPFFTDKTRKEIRYFLINGGLVGEKPYTQHAGAYCINDGQHFLAATNSVPLVEITT